MLRLTEPLLFVPFGINNDFHLYQVFFEIKPQSEIKSQSKLPHWRIMPGPDKENLYLEKKLLELGNYFRHGYYDKALLGQWHLIRPNARPEAKHLQDFTQNTGSITLGLFLGAFIKIRNRKFKSNWDVITVTGELDYDPVQTWFNLKAVEDIDKKYKDAFLKIVQEKKDAKKKYLFLYISNTEDIEKTEGLDKDKNIEVKRFSLKENSLEDIVDFLFEPYSLNWNCLPLGFELDDEQQKLISCMEKIDYICTSKFEEAARNLATCRSKGYFIYGEGGSGKSAMANALARYLLLAGNIYAPVWIQLNSKELLEKIKDEKEKRLKLEFGENDAIEDHIKKLIMEKTKNIDDKLYLFIFDNLELKDDNLRLVLTAIANIFSQKNQRIIITSRIDCSDEIKVKMNLTSISPPELQENDIKKFVHDISQKNPVWLKKVKEKQDTAEYNEFINLLQQNFATAPLLMQQIIFLLSDKSIVEATEIAKCFCHTEGDIQKKAVEIYKPVLSLLSHNAKGIFFAIMYIDYYDKPIDKEHRFIAWLKEPELTNALKELRQSSLIYTLEEDNVTKYAIKSHIYIPFMFYEGLDGGINPDTNESYREVSVPFTRKLSMVIQHDMPPKFIKNVIEKEREVNEDDDFLSFYDDSDNFLILAATYSSNPEVLDILVQYSCEIDYMGESGLTLFHTALMFNPHSEIINWFITKVKEFKINIHKKNKHGQNAFHCAAYQNGNIDLFNWLYEQKVDINLKDRKGNRPFDVAIFNNSHPEVLSWFIKQKKFKMPKENTTYSILFGVTFGIIDYFLWALLINKEQAILEWFLDQSGLDINFKDKKGNNLLHLIALYEVESFRASIMLPTSRENIEWLIAQKPDLLNEKNSEDKTPQYYLDMRKNKT